MTKKEHRIYLREWRARRQQAGECWYCRMPRAAGKSMCQRHLDVHAKQERARQPRRQPKPIIPRPLDKVWKKPVAKVEKPVDNSLPVATLRMREMMRLSAILSRQPGRQVSL